MKKLHLLNRKGSVKLLTPTKRHAVPPSPLRTELIKLTAALFKHGSIDQELEGN